MRIRTRASLYQNKERREKEMHTQCSIKHTVIAALALAACASLQTEVSGNIVMGDAGSFGVLGASTVTNTGPSTIFGDVGVAPGTAITGFPPGQVFNGSIHSNNALAISAQADALTAYNQLAGLSSTQDLTGQDLGGMVLTPGVYSFSSSAFLTGKLTLDGQGQTNPLFVFQMGSTLITASDAEVNLINGDFDTSNDVYWQVGSSATLGTNTDFIGTIIADQSATLETGASLNGRVMALNAAVTLDSNFIFNSRAAGVPAPGALFLLGPAFFGSIASRRRTT
jgi:hypothetical protein